MSYLDANASEPLRPEARAALLEALDLPGNPASVHRAGRQARDRLEAARELIARRLGAAPPELVFTSGGTESNVLAIHALSDGGRQPVLAGATEHAAVLEAGPADQLPLERLLVERDGRLDPERLEHRLRSGTTPALVCLMLANNETGVLHPIREVAAICRRFGVLLHVDAVQAVGRIPVDLGELGADSLALSAHKIGGPKGAGALLLREPRALAPLLAGGGQERGRRGGTPALPSVAGFAAALEAALDGFDGRDRLRTLRERIEAEAAAVGARVMGQDAPRLDNTSCLVLPGRRAEMQLIALDLAGFCVSAGAACSSGKVARSHVLEAMGEGQGAGEAVRVSLPWSVTAGEVDGFIAAYRAMASRAPAGRAAA